MGNCCRYFFPLSLSSSRQSVDLLEITPSSYNPPALLSSPSSSRHPPSSFRHFLPNSLLRSSSQDDEASSPSLTRKDTQDLYISKKDAFLLNHRVSIEDFNLMRVLGRGTFGKVMLVELKTTSKEKEGRVGKAKRKEKDGRWDEKKQIKRRNGRRGRKGKVKCRGESLFKMKIPLIKFFRETFCNEDNEQKIYCTEEPKIAYKGGKEDFGRNKLSFYCKIALCISD